ncbi:hypothetical protein [Methylobacterium sp. ID0610]|uniref:hypothetical protein n=1 Tax=Methylobacterium carpenticola TaxID=3344827 RepID=UPI0036B6B45E
MVSNEAEGIGLSVQNLQIGATPCNCNARAAKGIGYDTPQAQLQAAANYMANRDKEREKVVQREVTEQLDKLDDRWLKEIRADLGGQELIENPNLLRNRVSQQAALYSVAFGLKPKDAISAAIKNTRSHYTVIHGMALDVNDRRIPPDFEELAKDHLNEVYKKYGKELGISSARDLYLVPSGEMSDVFIIMAKGRLIGPIGALGVPGEETVLTPEKLDAARERIRSTQIKNATDPVQKAIKRTQEPAGSFNPAEDDKLR